MNDRSNKWSLRIIALEKNLFVTNLEDFTHLNFFFYKQITTDDFVEKKLVVSVVIVEY